MRITPTKSRWATPHRRYTGYWTENPWINATLLRSTAPPQDDDIEQRPQSAAMRVWENEGGSLGTQRSTRR